MFYGRLVVDLVLLLVIIYVAEKLASVVNLRHILISDFIKYHISLHAVAQVRACVDGAIHCLKSLKRFPGFQIHVGENHVRFSKIGIFLFGQSVSHDIQMVG